MNTKTSLPSSRLDAGVVAQVGALASAVVASACCWLPLLLIAVGVSSGALSATLEAWRPVLLPITFALLGLAFYFTYRNPKAATQSAAEKAAGGEALCAVPTTESKGEEVCCPPANAKGLTLKKVNKVMLWVVTAFVLAFAFFPNYVGFLFGGGGTLAAREDLDKFVVAIQGMMCEACAVNIESALQNVPGVVAAEVSYGQHQAIIGVTKGLQPPREAILSAISGAGSYQGHFTDQVQWTLEIEGMTCEGCASGLQTALSTVPGVTSASVSYEEGRARVAAGSSVTEEILRRTVSETGYAVKAVEKQ